MPLVIDGITVPEYEELLTQRYKTLNAATPFRMGDGSLRETIAWGGKLSTTITGSSWTPSGLENIDFTDPVVVKCVAPRIISSLSNVIALPSARRTDSGYLPTGEAVVNGKLIETPINLAGDIATLDVVSGASAYRVMLYPEVTAKVVFEDHGVDTSTGNYTWTLKAEEV